MTIEIICPLYNGELFLSNLHASFLKQKKVKLLNIHYVVTKGTDHTLELVSSLKDCTYDVIDASQFSHSLTRETAALKSKADIIVFVTQDVVIESDLWLYHLTKNIGKGKCAAAYSRQISKFNNIEKYTRESNYPENSFFVSKKDLEKLGLKTFFFSDASGAIQTKVFKKLKAYDGKRLPISEDMYFTYKLIMNGYEVWYEAESVVYHSHSFSLKELYKRYRLTGLFFQQNPYLDQYGTNKSGGGMAKYILKRAIQDKNFKVLCRYPFDMAARFIGMKVGKMKK